MCPSAEEQPLELPIRHWERLIQHALERGHSAEVCGLILGIGNEMGIDPETLLLADDPIDELVIVTIAHRGVESTKKILEVGRQCVAAAERRLGEAEGAP